MSDEIDLQEKFPDLRPIKAAPSLFTLNGCGLMIYGQRDYDAETGTYVKTHCLTLVFIPVLAIGAYRVASAAQGWYFLGKVPLSSFARACNALVLSLVVALGGFMWWSHHTSSPDYLAGKKLSEAEALAQAGQLGQAASLYLEVAQGSSGQVETARQRLQELIDGPAQQAAPAEAAGVLRVAAALHRQRGDWFPKVFDQGMELAKQHAAADPGGAVALIDAVAPVAKDPAELIPLRQQLLERELAQHPDNVEALAKLALIYEEQGQLDQCEKLLLPHSAKLGSGEAARILGQILAHQDRFDQAYPLLQAYTDERLQQLRAAEARFDQAIKAAEDRITKELKDEKAPGFNYQRHERANPLDREGMVRDYFQSRFKGDPAMLQAQEAMARESKVVPVALDLGIVLLRRAQSMADPQQRQAELERAEKTFLAVRGQAGQTDHYRAFLGQVYYWLGKQDQGQQLFDELLASRQRQTDTLLLVSRLLREVGAVSEARPLAEEAYNQETDQAKKHHAARIRSLIWIDLDDEISWLRKANPADPGVKASLSYSLGNQAIRGGRDQEAAGHYRDAIAAFEKQSPSASSYNDAALAYLALYHVSGNLADLQKGGELLDQAMALQPSDSILVRNAAFTLLEAAARDLIGPAIDLKALKMEGNLSLLAYLYNDRAGRDQLRERGRKHPGLAKALAYFDRLALLAPKDPITYQVLSSLHEFNRNPEGMREILRRIQATALDLGDQRRSYLDHYAGKDDAKDRKDMEASIERGRTALAGAAQQPKAATYAVAAVTLAGRLMRGADLNLKVNPDEIVKLSEEAHAAAPSRGTARALMSAVLFRADLALGQQDPGYRALLDKTRRSLDGSYRLALALQDHGSLRGLVLANADFQRGLVLLKEQHEMFPDEPSLWTWAIYRAAAPELVEPMAKAIQADEIGKLDRAIEQLAMPLNAAVAYRDCWYCELSGDPAKGKASLQRRADQGMPMWLPK